MKILAIDPGSANVAGSTNGIVLLDNAKLVNHWVVPSAKVRDIRNWFEEVGRFLDVDVVVIEKFEARDNDKSKDNSVLENVALFQVLFPERARLPRNIDSTLLRETRSHRKNPMSYLVRVSKPPTQGLPLQ